MAFIRQSIRHSHQKETCELKANNNETKDDFEAELHKALWHTFDVLDTGKADQVHVSQLKVIASSVGLQLGFKKAEELFNKEGLPTSLGFQAFYDIIKSDIIDHLEIGSENDGKMYGEYLNSVIKTCWKLCDFERQHKIASFSNDHCSILWRIFNFLAETDAEGNVILPIRLHHDEAVLLFKEFIEITGQRKKDALVRQFSEERAEQELLTFTDLLNIFERDFVAGLSRNAINLGVNPLYDKYILNILQKGMLWKRGYKVKSWKERWFVLTPTQMKYYVGQNEKEMKGAIEFDMECSIEVPADRPTNRQNRFVITTKKKPYDMSAPDVRTKNEWVSAIEVALDRVGKSPNIQREAARKRCCARIEKKRQEEEEARLRAEEASRYQSELDEEKKRRLKDEELLKASADQLEAERRLRLDAEARFAEEQALREAEQQRLRELEAIKRELERLLAEERQAKKDEEIVRALQARLLEEEFEKREELEKLKQQQEKLLEAEREQKAVLETDRKEQERLLREAKERLEQLERERAAAAGKMQEAADKLQKAERDRQIMEDKVKLWKTPVGLARPIQPHSEPLLTHRGLGAFCEQDFIKKKLSMHRYNQNAGGSEDKCNEKVSAKETEKIPSISTVGTIIQSRDTYIDGEKQKPGENEKDIIAGKGTTKMQGNDGKEGTCSTDSQNEYEKKMGDGKESDVTDPQEKDESEDQCKNNPKQIDEDKEEEKEEEETADVIEKNTDMQIHGRECEHSSYSQNKNEKQMEEDKEVDITDSKRRDESEDHCKSELKKTDDDEEKNIDAVEKKTKIQINDGTAIEDSINSQNKDAKQMEDDQNIDINEPQDTNENENEFKHDTKQTSVDERRETADETQDNNKNEDEFKSDTLQTDEDKGGENIDESQNNKNEDEFKLDTKQTDEDEGGETNNVDENKISCYKVVDKIDRCDRCEKRDLNDDQNHDKGVHLVSETNSGENEDNECISIESIDDDTEAIEECPAVLASCVSKNTSDQDDKPLDSSEESRNSKNDNLPENKDAGVENEDLNKKENASAVNIDVSENQNGENEENLIEFENNNGEENNNTVSYNGQKSDIENSETLENSGFVSENNHDLCDADKESKNDCDLEKPNENEIENEKEIDENGFIKRTDKDGEVSHKWV